MTSNVKHYSMPVVSVSLAAALILMACSNGGHKSMRTDFPEQDWQAAVVPLLITVNKLNGNADLTRSKFTLDDDALIRIGSGLADGSYDARAWFSKGAPASVEIAEHGASELDPRAHYKLLRLRALDPLRERVSSAFDGIVFEDPFYALLACRNIGAFHKLFVLPSPTDWNNNFERRGSILKALGNGSYRPENYFVECLGIGRADVLPMDIVEMNGEYLFTLRYNGMATLNQVGVFSLYSYRH